MKRLLLFTLFSLFAVYSNAHTEEPDPLSFFPHHVGDTWVYLYEGANVSRAVVTKVETDSENNILVYQEGFSPPAYKITPQYEVYFAPTSSNYLDYKLNAVKHDTWRVAEYEVSNLIARVQNIYKASVFSEFSTVMEIAYFEVPGTDTIITDESPYRYTHFLAAGIGFIRKIGESGDVPIDLIGCIIDGDTLGIVTGVNEEETHTSVVHIFPNPCSSYTTIHVSPPVDIHTPRLDVIDIFGRILRSADIQTDSYTLDTSTLPDGIYFCRVTAGTHTAVRKIIVRG